MQVALNSILPLHFLISNFRIFLGQTCICNCAQSRSILFWFDEFICLLWLCIQTHKHKSNSNFFQINKQINPFNAFKPHTHTLKPWRFYKMLTENFAIWKYSSKWRYLYIPTSNRCFYQFIALKMVYGQILESILIEYLD